MVVDVEVAAMTTTGRCKWQTRVVGGTSTTQELSVVVVVVGRTGGQEESTVGKISVPPSVATVNQIRQ